MIRTIPYAKAKRIEKIGNYPVDLDITEKLGISICSSAANAGPLSKLAASLASLKYSEFALRGLALGTDA
jgi:hypothetical protein